MNVLIVSRTHMGSSSACVGGLGIEDGQSIRVFDQHGTYPSVDKYAVGQLWDMDVVPRATTRPPHVEDVLVQAEQLLAHESGMRAAILEVVDPWTGDIDSVFEGTLRVANSKLYVPPNGPIPSCSTGFWIADRALAFQADEARYDTTTPPFRSIKYVGLDDAAPAVAIGTLVRLSLAGWYQGDYLSEERCYLQVSGSFDHG